MLKILLLGSGRMGEVHAQAYKACGKALVCAVVEPCEERGRAFAQRHGCLWYPALEAVPASLAANAVDICLPTHLHAQAILQSAARAPYLVCEKPLCIGAAGLAPLRERLGQTGAQLMVAHVLRFDAGYEALRAQLPTLGPVHAALARRRQKRPAWSAGSWLFDLSKSGGIVYDLAIHDIDWLVGAFGAPARVSAFATPEPDIHAIVCLAWPDRVATILASWGMPDGPLPNGWDCGMELLGEAGSLTLDAARPGLLTVNGGAGGERPFTLCSAYERELDYFCTCIERGEAPVRADLASVEQTLRVCDAAIESIQSGRTAVLSCGPI